MPSKIELFPTLFLPDISVIGLSLESSIFSNPRKFSNTTLLIILQSLHIPDHLIPFDRQDALRLLDILRPEDQHSRLQPAADIRIHTVDIDVRLPDRRQNAVHSPRLIFHRDRDDPVFHDQLPALLQDPVTLIKIIHDHPQDAKIRRVICRDTQAVDVVLC